MGIDYARSRSASVGPEQALDCSLSSLQTFLERGDRDANPSRVEVLVTAHKHLGALLEDAAGQRHQAVYGWTIDCGGDYADMSRRGMVKARRTHKFLQRMMTELMDLMTEERKRARRDNYALTRALRGSRVSDKVESKKPAVRACQFLSDADAQVGG